MTSSLMVLGEVVKLNSILIAINPLLSPKQHKETANDGAGILKDLGPHLIDQAVYFLDFLKRICRY
jgi:predicted dehydrogenase